MNSLATVVAGMLGLLMQRIENSAAENETFVLYFENYIKIWEMHIAAIEKNAKKFIQPLRLEHQTHGSKFVSFLEQVENLDLVYSANSKVFVKKVRQLVN